MITTILIFRPLSMILLFKNLQKRTPNSPNSSLKCSWKFVKYHHRCVWKINSNQFLAKSLKISWKWRRHDWKNLVIVNAKSAILVHKGKARFQLRYTAVCTNAHRLGKGRRGQLAAWQGISARAEWSLTIRNTTERNDRQKRINRSHAECFRSIGDEIADVFLGIGKVLFCNSVKSS